MGEEVYCVMCVCVPIPSRSHDVFVSLFQVAHMMCVCVTVLKLMFSTHFLYISLAAAV